MWSIRGGIHSNIFMQESHQGQPKRDLKREHRWFVILGVAFLPDLYRSESREESTGLVGAPWIRGRPCRSTWHRDFTWKDTAVFPAAG
jgi:hypothetical protein